MAGAYTWESLRALTMRRQFPAGSGSNAAAVVALVDRVGPIQSQTARAPFLAVSSRLPGVSNITVTAAYESCELVRATSLRGTVHTSARDQHRWLDAVSRRTSAALWARTFAVSPDVVMRAREQIEAATAADWVTHAEIEERLTRWLETEGFPAAVEAIGAGVGRALLRGHSALLRRPLKGGWHQQGLAGYRSAATVLGGDLVDPDEALARLVRQHLRAFGPATRRDIGWWTGDGLRRVDAAVRRLGDEVVSRPGPSGLDYLDLVDPPGDGADDPGLRLLPEFDGLLLGYAPEGRARFADADAIAFAWNRANGLMSPVVLLDGKLRGTWRLSKDGGTTALQVTMLPREQSVGERDVGDQAAAVASVLATPVDAVEVRPASR